MEPHLYIAVAATAILVGESPGSKGLDLGHEDSVRKSPRAQHPGTAGAGSCDARLCRLMRTRRNWSPDQKRADFESTAKSMQRPSDGNRSLGRDVLETSQKRLL